MTRTLVLYAHPYTGSFNHAVLGAVTDALEAAGCAHDVIDLHAEGFDPRYTTEELALFREGGTLDPLVTRYQELLMGADRLIIICPVWWSDVPAIVKGFIDKVMKQNWAYVASPTVKGRLTHIRRVLVLTTSTGPTWYVRIFSGNAIARILLGTTLRQLGMKGRRWVNYGRVSAGGAERRRRHLERVARLAVGS